MAEDKKTEDEKKKKKPTLGDKLRNYIMRGTGADKVVEGFEDEDDKKKKKK